MAAGITTSERVSTYCALCVSRCGAIATVEEGRFVRLDPDPSHPTGHALCAKGRAGPELVHHRDRLKYPLKRTRPKGDPHPGWQRLTRTFGSPNFVVAMELCGWGRHLATSYTFGAPVPGRYLPDLENAGCILFSSHARPGQRVRASPSVPLRDPVGGASRRPMR